MKAAYFGILLAFCSSSQAEIKNLIRIDEHLYRGRQPRTEDYPKLAAMGIHTVLDLRGGPIHKPRERKQVEAAGMQYISMRLSGIWEPKNEQIGQILKVLEDPARWPVFVHCKRGDDRLGMVVACYRMAHDHWSNQQAFDEARGAGLSRFEILMRRYIHHFDPAKVQIDASRAQAQ